MGKKIIGYTCGVYDLFHVGHLNLFERCKEQCDYLIVGVCDDEYVKKYKDKTPVICENDRLRIVKALKCVDDAILINSEETVDKLIIWQKLNYDKLFVGSDWQNTDRFKKTMQQFKDCDINVEIVFFPYTQGVSSTKIKEKLIKKN